MVGLGFREEAIKATMELVLLEYTKLPLPLPLLKATLTREAGDYSSVYITYMRENYTALKRNSA